MHSDNSFTWLDRSLDVHDLPFHMVANRRLIVHFFRRHFGEVFGRPFVSVNADGCICLVGSVARGEFDIENSDVDLWFLGFDAPTRNEILKTIAQEFKPVDIGLSGEDLRLILSNQGNAQHRDWKKYPCLDETDFHSSAVRRVQILFETVAVYNNERHRQLQKVALRAAGVVLRGREVRQNVEQIYRDIDVYSSTLEKLEYANAVDYAKQLVSRRLCQHLMRLSVLEAVFRKKVVTESPDPEGKFIEILQKPTAWKALFWASSEFMSGMMMTRISGQEFQDLHRKLRGLARRTGFGFPSTSYPPSCVGRFAIQATREYSSALNLLHSPALRAVLLEINDFTLVHHAKDPNLDQLAATARRFLGSCTALVTALKCIFLRYDAASLFARPYPDSGLEAAVRATLTGLLNDPLANDD